MRSGSGYRRQSPVKTLHELEAELEGLQAQWQEKQATFARKTMPNGESAPVIPTEDVGILQKLMADMDVTGKQVDELRAIATADANVKARQIEDKTPVNRVPVGAPANEAKTFLAQFKSAVIGENNSRWYMQRQKDYELDGVDPMQWLANPGIKTLMTTSSDGYPPEVLRTGGVTLSIQRPVQFLDVLPMRTTTQTSLKFMTETVLTDTADAQTEGTAVTDSVLTYAESTGSIRKIGSYIKFTEEQISDEPGLQSLVEGRMVFMVRRELDREALVGTGGANIVGLYNASGISTQAKGADPIFDCMYKGMTKVRVDGRTTPELFVLHSTTWQSIRLTRTSDGVYIFGSPMDGDSFRCWGLPVYLNEELTGTAGSGTGLCAGVQEHVTLVMRTGVEIAINDAATSDDFLKSILTMRATVRAGLEVRRAKTACTLTSL